MNVSMIDMGGTPVGASVTPSDTIKPPAHTEARQEPVDDGAAREKVRQMIEKMQVHIDSMNVSLQYSTYGNHGERISVAIVNKETGDVIREIPQKEIQHLYARMSELAGMIFNRQI